MDESNPQDESRRLNYILISCGFRLLPNDVEKKPWRRCVETSAAVNSVDLHKVPFCFLCFLPHTAAEA